MSGEGGAGATGLLTVGNHVTAYDPATGKVSPQSVQHIWLIPGDERLDVTLHEDTLSSQDAARYSPARGGQGARQSGAAV